MKRLFHYGKDVVHWGFTNKNFVIGDLSNCTRPYRQIKELYFEKSDAIVPKSWTVYKCRSCDFVTHALRKKNSSPGIVNSNFDFAVVTSIVASRYDSSK